MYHFPYHYTLWKCVCVCVKNGLNRGRKDNSCNPFIFTHQSTALKLAHILIMSTGNQATSTRQRMVKISSSVHTELTPICCACMLWAYADCLFEETSFRMSAHAGMHLDKQRRFGCVHHGSEKMHVWRIGTGQYQLILARSPRKKEYKMDGWIDVYLNCWLLVNFVTF